MTSRIDTNAAEEEEGEEEAISSSFGFGGLFLIWAVEVLRLTTCL